MKTGRSAVIAALALLLVSISAANAARPWKAWSGHLTKKSFERVEPLLRQLEPGTALADSSTEEAAPLDDQEENGDDKK